MDDGQWTTIKSKAQIHAAVKAFGTVMAMTANIETSFY